MTTQDKLINRKFTLIELAEFLKNVSQACKIPAFLVNTFMTLQKLIRNRTSRGASLIFCAVARTLQKKPTLLYEKWGMVSALWVFSSDYRLANYFIYEIV